MDQPVGIVVNNIAIGAGGFGFNTRAGQMRHRVVIAARFLQSFDA